MSRITFDPELCGGRPCVRGMRIRVKDVLDLLAAGESEGTILADFPYLEPEDIRACLAFAASEVDHPVLKAASISQPFRSSGSEWAMHRGAHC